MALGQITPLLLQQLFGSQQIGQAAPPPQLGSTGVGQSGGSIEELARKSRQSGIIGGIPEALQNVSTQTPDVQPETEEPPSGFEKFFGNIDSTLSSPSKTLGIGALGQINPNLALAGLLASGFLKQ